jgi:hypothetical protein
LEIPEIIERKRKLLKLWTAMLSSEGDYSSYLKNDEWSVKDIALVSGSDLDILLNLMRGSIYAGKLKPYRYEHCFERDNIFAIDHKLYFYEPSVILDWLIVKEIQLPSQVLDWHNKQTKPTTPEQNSAEGTEQQPDHPVDDDTDWRVNARKIAEIIHQEKPLWNVEVLAEKTHKEMKERNARGGQRHDWDGWQGSMRSHYKTPCPNWYQGIRHSGIAPFALVCPKRKALCSKAYRRL